MSATSCSLSRNAPCVRWSCAAASSRADETRCCCNSRSSALSCCANPGNRAVDRNSRSSLNFFASSARSTITRPSSLRISRAGVAGFSQNERPQPIEGKNLQPRVARQFGIREQLTLDLKGGLLRRDEEHRRAHWIAFQLGANFLQAPKSFPGAGGADQKTDLHRFVFRQLHHARQFNAMGRTNTG